MRKIDCLLIGHNEMNFTDYEESIRQMGRHSGAYRDLNLNFIRYSNKPFHAAEIFNLFCCGDGLSGPLIKPLDIFATFSATIAYLGSWLNKHGLTFEYVNSFQAEKKQLAETLSGEDILTIAITTTYYTSVLPILEIVDFIKHYNQRAKIIVGGPFVSNQVRSLEPVSLDYLFSSIEGVDIYVNSSQGETALLNIIGALKNGNPLEHINNIYYKKKGCNGFIASPTIKENNRLSENQVNWDLFADRAGECVNVRTAISCPFSCAFCGSPKHAGDYQRLEAKDIEKELNQLHRVESVKFIHFIEDTFNIPVKRFKEILRMMVKNKYRFIWHSYFRCQFADREMVELMKKSGCMGVYLGLESGNNRVLENMNKAVKVEEYFKGIELLKEYDIIMLGSFVLGFPGETVETTADTIRFIEESGIDFYRVQPWYCLPIAPIWQEREKYHLRGESFEWSHATMDSETTFELLEELFLTIEKSTWVPQYNFDINNLFQMLQRGISMEQVKNFLRAFNSGIKEKLKAPSQKEASSGVINRLKQACQAEKLSTIKF